MSFNDNNYFKDKLKGDPLSEMGNSQATSSPFGNGSMFDTNLCGDFKDNFHIAYGNDINIGKLVSFLQKDAKSTAFDWKKFLSGNAFLDLYDIPSEKRSSTYVAPNFYVPQKPEELFSYSKLNKRICYVNTSPSYDFNVQLSEQSIELRILFPYTETEQYRTYTNSPALEGAVNFTLNEKYIAIELATSNITAYAAVLRGLGVSSIKDLLIDKFRNLRKKLNRSDLHQVNWFYSILPDFILDSFDKKDLWEDLKVLLSFDESKWFVDNSSTMLKVMKSIAAQENGEVYLYDQFHKSPKFIKDLYNALNGQGEFGGEIMPSKSVFAAILLAITYAAYTAKGTPFSTEISFTFSDTMRVDSNIIFPDRSDAAFNLTQESFNAISDERRRSNAAMALNSGASSPSREWQTVGETQILHPLRLVNVTLPANGDEAPVTVPLPAIMVKDIAYKAEWGHIENVLRFGFNVLALIGGAVTLTTTGNPAVIFLAIADIGLAATDIVVQALKDPLMETEWGKEFVATWEKIYNIGGLAIAVISAPQLIQSVLSSGARIIHSATGATRTFIKQVLVSIILQKNIAKVSSSTLKSVEVGVEVLKKAKIKFVPAAASRLEEKGVVFVRLVDDAGVERYSAVYKGEVIVPNGSSKELRKSLDGAWNKTGDDLVKELDEIRLDFVTKDMNSIRLNRLQFDKWVEIIQKSGGAVKFLDSAPSKVVEHFIENNAGAAFQADAIPPTIWVIKGNVSDLEMFHESMHFEDFLRRGKRNYNKGVERHKDEVEGFKKSNEDRLIQIGLKSQIPDRDQLISTYIKERYVYNKIIEEQLAWQKKYGHGRFSKNDMAHSSLYIIEISKLCIDEGIDLSKITIKK